MWLLVPNKMCVCVCVYVSKDWVQTVEVVSPLQVLKVWVLVLSYLGSNPSSATYYLP